MSETRSKVVPVEGHKFQVRRLPSNVGSFILMRMLGASMRLRQDDPPKKLTEEEDKKLQESIEDISPEERVRALSFVLFSGGMSLEDFTLLQNSCMKCLSLIVMRSDQEFPVPIMNDAGAWTPEGLPFSTNFSMLTQLTQEVLILCFADFFAKRGPGLQS